MTTSLSRRAFIGASASCAAQLVILGRAHGLAADSIFARTNGTIVAQEAWGRIERIADGVWALVSTPLQNRLTLCNGAIVAGSSRVLVIEAVASVDGARWLIAQAERLTGRKVDDVVVTHFHADHTGGIGAFASPLLATSTTRDLVIADDAKAQRTPDARRTQELVQATSLSTISPTAWDLGGRTLRIVPRQGHTASDVTIELDDPSIVIAGDLLWNGMFPNYVNAVPSQLSRSVRALVRERETVYVPGHGPIADTRAVSQYLELLDTVEQVARRAFDRGLPAADAAKEFKLPSPQSGWTLFNPRYYETAINAWHKELAGGR